MNWKPEVVGRPLARKPAGEGGRRCAKSPEKFATVRCAKPGARIQKGTAAFSSWIAAIASYRVHLKLILIRT
jgi:hypothetical protein